MQVFLMVSIMSSTSKGEKNEQLKEHEQRHCNLVVLGQLAEIQVKAYQKHERHNRAGIEERSRQSPEEKPKLVRLEQLEDYWV